MTVERLDDGDDAASLMRFADIAMYDSLLAWTPNVMGPPFAEGRAPAPKDEACWMK